EEWKFRRSNYANISTTLIDRLMAVASKTGGRAAKACGAGGGGCVVFMVREGAKERVAQALRMNGGTVLPCRVNPTGLRVEDDADAASMLHVPVAGGNLGRW